MASKFVRAPNNPGLIVAGMLLLLLAAVGTGEATNVNDYRVPSVVRAAPAIRDGILAAALLFVALRNSRFAGPTAVIIATLLTFGFVFPLAMDAVVSLPLRVSWFSASHLAVAAILLWSLLFPWSRSANRPVVMGLGSTFAVLTVFVASLALLARL